LWGTAPLRRFHITLTTDRFQTIFIPDRHIWPGIGNKSLAVRHFEIVDDVSQSEKSIRIEPAEGASYAISACLSFLTIRGLESVASPSSVTPDKGKFHGPKKAMTTINIKLH